MTRTKARAYTKEIGETVRSDRIRTCDHIIPNDVRYQAALHSAILYSIGYQKDDLYTIQFFFNERLRANQ